MHKTDIEKVKKQLNKVVSFVDPTYIDALLLLHKILVDEHVEWAVGGDLGEALKMVQAEPDCIEIIASKEEAEKIFSAVKEYNPKAIDFHTIKLARNANINNIDYPIYLRSYFFEFFVGCVKVNVHGDMQYRLNDWEWGDKLEFIPEYVNVTGVQIPVVPLDVKQEIYKNIGWTDTSEKIDPIIERQKQIPV